MMYVSLLEWQRRRMAFAIAASTTVLLMSLLSAVQSSYQGLSLPTPPTQQLTLFSSWEEESISPQRIFVKGAGGNNPNYRLTDGAEVLLQDGDDTRTLTAQDETVWEFINRISRRLPEDTLLLMDVSALPYTLTPLTDGTFTDTYAEPTTAEAVRVADYTLPKGTEELRSAGIDGTCQRTYTFTVADGSIQWSELTDETTSTAVAAEIAYGTLVESVADTDTLKEVIYNEDGSGYLLFASGDSLRFTRSLTCRATAYTSGHDGVGTRTASGKTVSSLTVATDKSVIPLGTDLYICTKSGSSLGMRQAQDTGPSIRGERVDIYLPSYQECISFGVRSVEVYILP